jgi:hypothetical protein
MEILAQSKRLDVALYNTDGREKSCKFRVPSRFRLGEDPPEVRLDRIARQAQSKPCF